MPPSIAVNTQFKPDVFSGNATLQRPENLFSGNVKRVSNFTMDEQWRVDGGRLYKAAEALKSPATEDAQAIWKLPRKLALATGAGMLFSHVSAAAPYSPATDRLLVEPENRYQPSQLNVSAAQAYAGQMVHLQEMTAAKSHLPTRRIKRSQPQVDAEALPIASSSNMPTSPDVITERTSAVIASSIDDVQLDDDEVAPAEYRHRAEPVFDKDKQPSVCALLREHKLLRRKMPVDMVLSAHVVVAALRLLRLDEKQNDGHHRQLLAQAILRDRGHYGGAEDEHILPAQQISTIRVWFETHFFGNLEEQLIEHLIERGWGAVFTTQDLSHWLKFKCYALFNHGLRRPRGREHVHESSLEQTFMRQVGMDIFPMLAFVHESDIQQMVLVSPMWGKMHAGLLASKNMEKSANVVVNEQAKEQAHEIGIFLEALITQSPTDHKNVFAFFRLPARCYQAKEDPDAARLGLWGSSEKNVSLLSAFKAYFSANTAYLEENTPSLEYQRLMKEYKTRPEFALDVIQHICGNKDLDTSTLLTVGEVSCVDKSAPYVDPEAQYDAQNRKIASAYKELAKMMLLPAWLRLSDDDLAFLSRSKVQFVQTVHDLAKKSTDFANLVESIFFNSIAAKALQVDGYSLPRPMSEYLEGIDVFMASSGEEKRVYEMNRQGPKFKVRRVAKFVEATEIEDLLVLALVKAQESVSAAFNDVSVSADSDTEFFTKLIDALAQEQEARMYSQLKAYGYESTIVESIFSFLKGFIPFVHCYEGLSESRKADAVIDCSLDVLTLIPVFTATGKVVGKLGKAAFQGMNKMISASAESALRRVIRQGVSKTFDEFYTEIGGAMAKSVSRADARKVLGEVVQAVDPFFLLGYSGIKRLIMLGESVGHYFRTLPQAMSAFKKYSERLHKAAYSGKIVSARLPGGNQLARFGTLLGADGMKVLVRIDPVNNLLYGKKYVKDAAGRLTAVAVPPIAERKVVHSVAESVPDIGAVMQKTEKTTSEHRGLNPLATISGPGFVAFQASELEMLQRLQASGKGELEAAGSFKSYAETLGVSDEWLTLRLTDAGELSSIAEKRLSVLSQQQRIELDQFDQHVDVLQIPENAPDLIKATIVDESAVRRENVRLQNANDPVIDDDPLETLQGMHEFVELQKTMGENQGREIMMLLLKNWNDELKFLGPYIHSHYITEKGNNILEALGRASSSDVQQLASIAQSSGSQVREVVSQEYFSFIKNEQQLIIRLRQEMVADKTSADALRKIERDIIQKKSTVTTCLNAWEGTMSTHMRLGQSADLLSQMSIGNPRSESQFDTSDLARASSSKGGLTSVDIHLSGHSGTAVLDSGPGTAERLDDVLHTPFISTDTASDSIHYGVSSASELAEMKNRFRTVDDTMPRLQLVWDAIELNGRASLSRSGFAKIFGLEETLWKQLVSSDGTLKIHWTALSRENIPKRRLIMSEKRLTVDIAGKLSFSMPQDEIAKLANSHSISIELLMKLIDHRKGVLSDWAMDYLDDLDRAFMEIEKLKKSALRSSVVNQRKTMTSSHVLLFIENYGPSNMLVINKFIQDFKLPRRFIMRMNVISKRNAVYDTIFTKASLLELQKVLQNKSITFGEIDAWAKQRKYSARELKRFLTEDGRFTKDGQGYMSLWKQFDAMHSAPQGSSVGRGMTGANQWLSAGAGQDVQGGGRFAVSQQNVMPSESISKSASVPSPDLSPVSSASSQGLSSVFAEPKDLAMMNILYDGEDHAKSLVFSTSELREKGITNGDALRMEFVGKSVAEQSVIKHVIIEDALAQSVVNGDCLLQSIEQASHHPDVVIARKTIRKFEVLGAYAGHYYAPQSASLQTKVAEMGHVFYKKTVRTHDGGFIDGHYRGNILSAMQMGSTKISEGKLVPSNVAAIQIGDKFVFYVAMTDIPAGTELFVDLSAVSYVR